MQFISADALAVVSLVTRSRELFNVITASLDTVQGVVYSVQVKISLPVAFNNWYLIISSNLAPPTAKFENVLSGRKTDKKSV